MPVLRAPVPWLVERAGWVLLPWAHGKGYAAEAMAAVLEWRDAHLPDREIFCIITPDNAPSLRLAGRLGFTVTGEASTPEDRVLVLTRQS